MSDNALGPRPSPPAELLDFLRRAEASDEVPDDLRLKARIARESLETGERPVLSDPGSTGAITRVTVGVGGSRVYEVYASDTAAGVDAVTAVHAIGDKAPSGVRAFLLGLAAGTGNDLLVGLITDVMARCESDLTGRDAYVCGPPPMVDAAIEKLTALGVREDSIFYDKFTTTGEQGGDAS